jgi:alkylation response protein AidB-like acyl-CoA dehydrogenase
LAFELTQEQELLRETARDFAEKEILPLAPKIDSERQVPSDLLAKLSILGLLGVSVPQKFGGAGADFVSQFIVSEEVSRASGSLGLQVSFHNGLVCDAILASDNDSLKESLLPKLVSGGCGALDLTGALTNVPDKESSAHQGIECEINASDLTINGTSDHVLSASSATVFFITAKVANSNDTVAFAFSKDSIGENSGFRVGSQEKLLGMRAGGTASITFSNLKLSSDNFVYDPKSQDSIKYDLLPRSRLASAAVALGIAQASVDASIKYANERIQFNKKIGSFYAVQDMIAMSEIELETARSLAYRAASRVHPVHSTDDELVRESVVAKISASLAAVNSARRAIRVHGGYGFMRDYPVERFARDARLTPLFPETNEELKSLLARSLLGT